MEGWEFQQVAEMILIEEKYAKTDRQSRVIKAWKKKPISLFFVGLWNIKVIN